jgi:hypothetical protein
MLKANIAGGEDISKFSFSREIFWCITCPDITNFQLVAVNRDASLALLYLNSFLLLD